MDEICDHPNVEEILERVADAIMRVGWFAVGVHPGPDDDPTPQFTYSIGLWEYGHPEVIIVGLHPIVAHSVIGTMHERIEADETFRAGERVGGIIDDYDVEFRAVPPDGRPLNLARRYYDVDELPALQIVWPDRDGLFPGEEGFDEEFDVQGLEVLV